MNLENLKFVMILEEDLICLKTNQEEILKELKDLKSKVPGGIPISNITAKEFMNAVKIGRTKFDQLVQTNKIKVIKKRRKIYVPIGEVERYFNDPLIR